MKRAMMEILSVEMGVTHHAKMRGVEMGRSNLVKNVTMAIASIQMLVPMLVRMPFVEMESLSKERKSAMMEIATIWIAVPKSALLRSVEMGSYRRI
jgi:ACR3 family arsenite efflux pump ArsB